MASQDIGKGMNITTPDQCGTLCMAAVKCFRSTFIPPPPTTGNATTGICLVSFCLRTLPLLSLCSEGALFVAGERERHEGLRQPDQRRLRLPRPGPDLHRAALSRICSLRVGMYVNVDIFSELGVSEGVVDLLPRVARVGPAPSPLRALPVRLPVHLHLHSRLRHDLSANVLPVRRPVRTSSDQPPCLAR